MSWVAVAVGASSLFASPAKKLSNEIVKDDDKPVVKAAEPAAVRKSKKLYPDRGDTKKVSAFWYYFWITIVGGVGSGLIALLLAA